MSNLRDKLIICRKKTYFINHTKVPSCHRRIVSTSADRHPAAFHSWLYIRIRFRSFFCHIHLLFSSCKTRMLGLSIMKVKLLIILRLSYTTELVAI